MSSTQPTAPQSPEVKVIRSAKRKKTVQARMVSGVLEVRIPAWMSARDEREAVADMLARVEKKQAVAAARTPSSRNVRGGSTRRI